MTDLVWTVIVVVGIVVFYGLGRRHERDRARRGRVAPVVPLRREIRWVDGRVSGRTWGSHGASQVRIVPAPRAQQFRLYDWRNDDGGAG